MLWTLSASLLVMALVLIQFLKKIVEKVKSIYFVYPSEAVIDQALPQEIMEHIMTFLDPCAMIESRLVSKYWHHHANKPNVENDVYERAKQRYATASLRTIADSYTRLREVYDELNRKGLAISEQAIEATFLEAYRPGSLFLRAAAIAGKHGAELLVADSHVTLHIIDHMNWIDAKAEKKYFLLTATTTGQSPWNFSGNFSFSAVPQFDKDSVDWNETPPWTSVEVLIDATKLSLRNYQNEVDLYLYRLVRPPKHFHFIPLNDKLLFVLMYLLTPLVVHDALHASYLPTIKSWFGPIIFLASVVIQMLIMRSFTRYYTASKEFKIMVALFFAVYFLLTWLAYPVSMSIFAGVGIQSLMFMFVIFSRQYFEDYSRPGMTKKKWQVLVTGLVLMFLMVDWKLVVDSTRDLSIFRTLFDNTVCYCVILLHFIFDNFMGYCREGLKWTNLTRWDNSTIKTLFRSYSTVIWMTLLAPTWRGNHV